MVNFLLRLLEERFIEFIMVKNVIQWQQRRLDYLWLLWKKNSLEFVHKLTGLELIIKDFVGKMGLAFQCFLEKSLPFVEFGLDILSKKYKKGFPHSDYEL